MRRSATSAAVALLLALGAATAQQVSEADANACLVQWSSKVLTDLARAFIMTGNNTSPGGAIEAFSGAVKLGMVGFAACVRVSVSIEPVRIMVPRLPQDINMARWKKYASDFEARTGIKVILTFVDFGDMIGEAVFDATSARLMDGWIMEPSYTGTMDALGALADLGPLIQADPALQFSDYNRFLREVAAVMGKKVVGLPTDGSLLQMYYRVDVLQQFNLTVPQTWDDVLEVARTVHMKVDTDGDGKGDMAATCFNIAGRCMGSFMLPAVIASYVQYAGTDAGFYFDPATVPPRPLGDNEGVLAALRFWRDLTPYMINNPRCGPATAEFKAGTCALTFSWGAQFKGLYGTKLANVSVVGIAPLPGTTSVVDRSTGSLVPCTARLCRYGTSYTDPRTGEQGIINQTPFAALGGFIASVSARSTPTRQANAYKFFTYLISPDNSWADVLNPNVGVDPFRDAHMTNISRWVKAGYDRDLVTQYLQAVQASLGNHNIAPDVRLAYDSSGGLDYRDPYNAAIQAAMALPPNSTDDDLRPIIRVLLAGVGHVAPPPQAPAWLARTGRAPPAPHHVRCVLRCWCLQTLQWTSTRMVTAAVNRFMPGQPVALTQQYWSTLGKVGSALTLLPSPPPPSPAASPPSPLAAPSSGLSKRDTVIVAVLCSVGTALMLTAVLLGVWFGRRYMRKKHLGLMGQILPPRVGLQTTLVITDVQDSTTLFESLPVSVVDKCMQLLCGTTRALLHKYNGYESCTEGDSFMLAFHSAQDAVCFCIDLQAELLKQPWPVELLEVDGVPSVHNAWALPQSRAPLCTQMIVGHRIVGHVAPVPADGSSRVRWAEEESSTRRKLGLAWLGWVGNRGASPGARVSGPGRVSVETQPRFGAGLYLQPSRSFSDTLSAHSRLAEGMASGALGAAGAIGADADGAASDTLPSPRLGAAWGNPTRASSNNGGESSNGDDNKDTTPPLHSQLLRVGLGNELGSATDLQRVESIGPGYAPGEFGAPSNGSSAATAQSNAIAALLATAQKAGASGSGRLETTLNGLFRATGSPFSPNSATSKLGTMLSPAQVQTLMRCSDGAATPPGGVSSASFTAGPVSAQQQPMRLPPRTVRHALQAAWQLTSSLPGQAAEGATAPAANGPPAAAAAAPEPIKIWGGLRVRCAVASGLEEEPDVSQGRASYANTKLMNTVKALEACAHGGQVLMVESTLNALGQASLPARIAIVHMGKHAVSGAPANSQGPPQPALAAAVPAGNALLDASGPSVSLGLAAAQQAALDVPDEAVPAAATAQEGTTSHRLASAEPPRTPQPHLQPSGLVEETTASNNPAALYLHVFGACHAHLLPRITTLPPLKVADTLVLDVTHAPLDIVTISFMYLVGYSTLRAWNAHEAYVAQEQFADCAKRQLRAVGGYLVEVAEGFLLTAFSDPYASLRWALAVQRSMMHLPWARRLLEHELTEEVQVMQSDGKGGMQPVVLFRGPRIKVGMDMGSTRSEVHATIRRMAYRGKVMNRAARIAATAHAGQVLCSHEVWVAAALAGGGCPTDSQVAGLQCLQLGATNLKGIKERIKICQVSLDTTKGAWKGNLLQMAGALASG